jgi:hypothetical protein
MPAENGFYKLPAIVRYVAHFFGFEHGVQVILYFYQPALIEFCFPFFKLRFKQLRITDHRSKPPDDILICPEKIEEGKYNDQYQPTYKSQHQHGYFSIRHQFFVPLKSHGFNKIKNKEHQGHHTVVNTVF